MTSKTSTRVATATDLYRVIVQVRRLFHRLAEVADEAHRDLGVTASQRAVLETLSNDGPQTVPQIARRKAVTRQHIQILVNGLVERGHVALADNPAHQRSSLAALTAAVFAAAFYVWQSGIDAMAAAVGAMSLLLIWRHKDNVVRLASGKEGKIGAKK